MKTLKNKIAAITIAILLMLTLAASIMLLPSANAHTPSWNIPTWNYVSTSPQTVGVGQSVIIVMWNSFVPPTAVATYGDRWTFTVNVMKPGGTNDTLGPFTSDPVGAFYTTYTPTELGNYTIQSFFPGKICDNTPSGAYTGPTLNASAAGGSGGITDFLGDYFEPSASAPVTLVVQQEPIASYQETPLPTAYWTRPIYGTNHDWFVLAGQWLSGGDTTPSGSRANLYTKGPTTSHIDWAVPIGGGGLTGGGSSYTLTGANEYTGQSYEAISGPTIIEGGLLYYIVSSPPREGWYALNLYTGQVAYYQNTTGTVTANFGTSGTTFTSGSIPNGAPAFGQVLYYGTPNQYGTLNYLWVTATGVSGKWNMLDAYTGNYICSIANVTQSTRTAAGTTVTTGATGTSKTDNIGSICYYNIVNLGTTATPKRYLQIWNTTQSIQYFATQLGGTDQWLWRPILNFTFDGSTGFSLNASIPDVQGSIRQVVTDKYVIGGTTGNITTNPGQNTAGNLWALNLDPTKGALGTLLWNITFTPPPGLGDAAAQSAQYTSHDTAWGGLDAEAGIFYFTNSMLRVYYENGLFDSWIYFRFKRYDSDKERSLYSITSWTYCCDSVQEKLYPTHSYCTGCRLRSTL